MNTSRTSPSVMDKHQPQRIFTGIFADPFYRDPETRILAFAITISLVIHVTLLSILSFQNALYRKINRKNIEILYQVMPRTPKARPSPRDIKTIRQPDLATMPKSLVSQKNEMSSFMPKLSKSSTQVNVPKNDFAPMDVSRPQGLKIPVTDGKRQVSIPLLGSEKITNPKYLSYHDRIRNKIKNRAYLYVDNPSFEKGEVYLTFVVAASGEVTAIKMIEEKSRANDYLRGVGVRSIKESSPFPPFPEDLKYPELTFNVIISFETGE